MAEKYGVLRQDGCTERAIFIVDKLGMLQYIDIHDFDDQPDNEVLFAELKRIDPGAFAIPSGNQSAAEERRIKNGIVMYCNRWCPDCRRARQWFADHQIDYEDIDIVVNKDAADLVRSWADGKLITPTFDINGKIIFDWKEQELAALLLESK